MTASALPFDDVVDQIATILKREYGWELDPRVKIDARVREEIRTAIARAWGTAIAHAWGIDTSDLVVLRSMVARAGIDHELVQVPEHIRDLANHAQRLDINGGLVAFGFDKEGVLRTVHAYDL